VGVAESVEARVTDVSVPRTLLSEEDDDGGRSHLSPFWVSVLIV
jgi:hypothetical protein